MPICFKFSEHGIIIYCMYFYCLSVSGTFAFSVFLPSGLNQMMPSIPLSAPLRPPFQGLASTTLSAHSSNWCLSRRAREVSHHVIIAEEVAHRAQQREGVGVSAAHHFVEGALRAFVPVPGVLERLDLAFAAVPLGTLEQDVVIGVRIERRVEIDQIYALAGDMFAQDVQIVAEMMPPTITTANGRCVSEPIPCDNAAGSRPRPAISAVMMIGRMRSTAPSRTACSKGLPLRSISTISSTIMTPF